MVHKNWSKEEQSSVSGDGEWPNYNAVHYVYKDRIFSSRKFSNSDTKNSLKFREVLKKRKLELLQEEQNGNSEDHNNGSMEEKCVTESPQSEGPPIVTKKSKKKNKKHKKLKASEDESESMNIEKFESEVVKLKVKKKKKCKKSGLETEDHKVSSGNSPECLADVDMDTSAQSHESKKAKKRLKKLDSANVLNDTTYLKMKGNQSNKNVQSFDETDHCSQKVGEITEASSKRKKKKEKKQKRKSDCLEISDPVQSSSKESSGEVKPKKKKRKHSIDQETVVHSNTEENILTENDQVSGENEPSVKTKKKKKSDKGKDDKTEGTIYLPDSDASVKKSKKKAKNTHTDNDEMFLTGSAINGGQDSITSEEKVLKKSKKKKKKKEKEGLPTEKSSSELDSVAGSPKKKATKRSAGEMAGKVDLKDEDSPLGSVGQWGTVEFHSQTRQDKFLRLMGGKKDQGGKASSKSCVTGPRVNAALTAEQENKLNAGLENQYDTALNWMLEKKKGCGLGFEKDPAEGKKFHINANKTKSKKFED